MKKLVNGQIHEFVESTAYEIKQSDDLVLIKTDQGWKSAAVARQGSSILVSYRGRQYTVAAAPSYRADEESILSGEVRAPMPGVIVAVKVELGQQVEKNATVLVLEAMKTQIPIAAPFASQTGKLLVHVGDQVKADDLLAVFEKIANT
jgi:biotin carboxyl carrier protein